MVLGPHRLASNGFAIPGPSSASSAKHQRPDAGKVIEDLDIHRGNAFEACRRTVKLGGRAIWRSFLRGCELAAHARARFT
jgi:hypothetical protein